MLKDLSPRLYQETILATAVSKNVLVVLPTGLGKTAVALMLAAYRLKQYPESKILFLSPTKPLCQQHMQTFERHFDIPKEKFSLFTGSVSPEKRAELWKDAKVIFSTPQGIENDIISKRINLEEVSLLIFDEAHHATGDYAYVFIAKQYNKLSDRPRILGLTASPGSDVEKIQEVCKNLYIEDVEVRTESDPDVKPYVQQTDVEFVEVDLPADFKQVKNFLDDSFKSKIKELRSMGMLRVNLITKRELLMFQAELHSRISSGEKSPELWRAVSAGAEALKIYHAIELIETQGVEPLYYYFEKVWQEASSGKSKAVQSLVKDLHFRSAFAKTKLLYEEKVEHPKLAALRKIMKAELSEGKKAIVFSHYRDTASKITDELKKTGINAELFIGQSSKRDKGLSQKEQKELLEKFSKNDFNVLVATSVAEEGIDIPNVNFVVFYEPIPSAIRQIQRRGRTGRHEKGKVVILVAKGTRDEAYKWSAFHKERKMRSTLVDLKRSIKLHEIKKEKTLEQFSDNVKIFADHREKATGVIKDLVDLGADIGLQQLNVGDYVLSSRVGIECKTVPDFVDSIIDGRLLLQLKDLKNGYARPLLIIEGSEDIYSQRNIHPNAIRGMLATITVSYGVPVLYTKNSKDTAQLLYVIAKREQEELGKEFNPHADRKPMTLKEAQEYVISALPSVGPSLAKDLLKQFKTVRNVMKASEDDHKNVEKIGEKIAQRIREILDEDYKEK